MDIVFRIRKFLNAFIYNTCSIILILMVLDVTWQVTSRYVMNDPSSFTDEGARFLMIWLGMLGGALLFGKGGHLAVTIVSDKVSGQNKKVLSVIIYLLIAFFAIFSMIYGGFNLIARTIVQPSPSMHIPMGYIYSILPISACFILAYLVLNIIDVFRGYTTNTSKEELEETLKKIRGE